MRMSKCFLEAVPAALRSFAATVHSLASGLPYEGTTTNPRMPFRTDRSFTLLTKTL
jgi:hypothetical protein